jgi:AraC-like DNA-binding protein
MLEIRARYLERDLLESGLLEAFGDAVKGVDFMRFSDEEDGFFRGKGGLIGDGRISVSEARGSNCIIRLPEENTVRYEKAISGTFGVKRGDTEVAAEAGLALIVGADPDLCLAPAKAPVEGLATTVSLESLDRYLVRGGERRKGAVGHALIERSGPEGLDGALLSLTRHAVRYFDSYQKEGSGSAGRLMEALVIENFVGLLTAAGALKMLDNDGDAEAMAVRRAQEFMHAHYGRPLTMSDVANAADISLRRLEKSFRRLVGCTPRQFLSEVRLDRAREMLLERPTTTVTRAAGACGIAHLGRFELQYRLCFGESPSETLRRSRRR